MKLNALCLTPSSDPDTARREALARVYSLILSWSLDSTVSEVTNEEDRHKIEGIGEPPLLEVIAFSRCSSTSSSKPPMKEGAQENNLVPSKGEL